MEEEFHYKDTILKVKSDIDISDKVKRLITQNRQELEAYIAEQPEFETSLKPLKLLKDAPPIAKTLASAAEPFDVGPLAAVAGATSERIAAESEEWGAKWIIVENGGDICIRGDKKFTISIYAGDSPLSNKIGFIINPGKATYGICTSSASVGHSISFGEADAVTVCAKSTSLADAAATAIANEVKGEGGISKGLSLTKRFSGQIDGVLIIKGDKIGTAGKLPELIRLG